MERARCWPKLFHRALSHAVVINRDFKTPQDIMEAIGTPDRSREG
jgi:hypothetical protein